MCTGEIQWRRPDLGHDPLGATLHIMRELFQAGGGISLPEWLERDAEVPPEGAPVEMAGGARATDAPQPELAGAAQGQGDERAQAESAGAREHAIVIGDELGVAEGLGLRGRAEERP